MALLKLIDGTELFTDYNTAAKIWQIQNGNSVPLDDKEKERVLELVKTVIYIDFKRISK